MADNLPGFEDDNGTVWVYVEHSYGDPIPMVAAEDLEGWDE